MQQKRIKIIWLFIILIIFIIIILEILLRLTGIKPTLPSSCRKYDPLFYYSLIPNTTCRFKTTEWDISYKINSRGLRDFEYSVEKPENAYRILMLGDSFIEGSGVPLETSYPKLLEKALNENSPSKTEVIDAGVSAWSTIPEYFYLNEHGLGYKPDLVILNLNLTDFLDDFNFYNNLTDYGKSIMETKNPNKQKLTEPIFNLPQKTTVNQKDYSLRIKLWLDQNSAVYNLLRKKIKSINTLPLESQNIGNIHKDMFALTRPEKPNNYEEAFGKTENTILKMKQLLEKNKIDFLIVLIPHGHLVSASEWSSGRVVWGLKPGIVYSDRAFIDLENWARKNSIKTFNLTPVLKLASGNKKLYFDYDGHFNNDGQYAVAQAIFSYLTITPKPAL